MEVKSVGVIVGHTSKSPGAIVVSDVGRQSYEYFYNLEVAQILQKAGEINLLVLRDKIGIAGACKAIVESDVDFSIELHCNAANKSAQGCEALYYTKQSKLASDLFCADFCKRFGRKNRGSKYVVDNGRGISNLQLLSDVSYSVLVEPFFGDNQKDFVDPNLYADFLKDYIRAFKALTKKVI